MGFLVGGRIFEVAVPPEFGISGSILSLIFCNSPRKATTGAFVITLSSYQPSGDGVGNFRSVTRLLYFVVATVFAVYSVGSFVFVVFWYNIFFFFYNWCC